MSHWNKMYNIFLNVKKCYVANGGDLNKPFEEWIEYLDNDFFNSVFAIIQINEYKNRVLFRYGVDVMKPGFWNESNSLYRFARSTVVDKITDELLLSPFQKFFNLNEIEETSIDNILDKIQRSNSFGIMDKLDGSMISTRYVNNEIIMSGSQGLDTEKSYRLGIAYDLLTYNQKAMIIENPQYTFVFELIHSEDLHLVDYSEREQGLYLLGFVNMENGQESNIDETLNLAKIYGVLVAQPEYYKLEEILLLRQKFKANEKEGWIVNIDGYKVKIKCDDYVQLHRVFDLKGLENIVIQHLAENTFDDFLSMIPNHYKGRAEKIATEIMSMVKEINCEIARLFNLLESISKDKATFMILKDTVVPKELRGYVVNRYFGRVDSVLKTQHRARKYNEIINLYAKIKEN